MGMGWIGILLCPGPPTPHRGGRAGLGWVQGAAGGPLVRWGTHEVGEAERLRCATARLGWGAPKGGGGIPLPRPTRVRVRDPRSGRGARPLLGTRASRGSAALRGCRRLGGGRSPLRL